MCLGIGGRAVFVVLFLSGQGPRLIRNLAAFDNALTRRHAFLCGMILNVPGGGVHDLPDPRQIGLFVTRAWDRGGVWSLSSREARTGQPQRDDERERDKPESHTCPPGPSRRSDRPI